MPLVRSPARCRNARVVRRAVAQSGRAGEPLEVDPLRFGAGEAEAFHPLVKLRKHTSYDHLRQRFLLTV